MMGEAKGRPADLAQDIEIGSFGGERQGQRCQGRLAIQPGAPQAGPGQEVSDRLQANAYCAMRRVRVRNRVQRALECGQRLRLRGGQQCQRIGHNSDLNRQRAKQLSIGFHIDSRMLIRAWFADNIGLKVFAENILAVD